ncbi:MAG TPA: TolC family protein [Desulfobacteraceae bacterium]|nr:TolC family protein [Desulfobacteraceae bacterium]
MNRALLILITVFAVAGFSPALAREETSKFAREKAPEQTTEQASDPIPGQISENAMGQAPTMTAGGPLTLSTMAAMAYEANPSILAARKSWQQKIEQYNIATAYPDPQFMVTYFPDPIETRLGPQDWNAVISQKIPFPGKLGTKGRVVEADARMAKLALDKTVRDVMTRVVKSFHELAYIQQAKRIARENAGLLDQLGTMGKSAYAQDRAALTDVVKARSQTAQLRYDLLLLQELERTETTRLNGLLNRPPDALIGQVDPGPATPIVYDLNKLYAMAEKNQETIRMADLAVKQAQTRTELARYQALPDFKVGLFYAGIGHRKIDIQDSGRDALGIQFGMSLPLWFGRNSSRNIQALAVKEKKEAERAVKVNALRTKIHTLFFKLENARRLITLYRDDMIPQALQTLKTSETWFHQGEGSFSDFVEAQAAAYNFQLSLARARADYGRVLAELEQLAGKRLTGKQPGGGDNS